MIQVMGKPDFFADVVETGTIMGLDANMGPDAATAIMGTNCAETRDNTTFWRVYGLVELSWRKRKRKLGWAGEHFAVQAHRLDHAVTLDDAVRERYGDFAGPLTFTDLRAELGGRGVELVDLGERGYWQPEAQVTVHVDDGNVRQIVSAFGWTPSTGDTDQKAAWQQVKALADMAPEQRVRWGERKRPDWRHLGRLTAQYVSTWYDVPDRPKFVALTEWLWQQALTPAQTALARAEFVANLDEWHPELATNHAECVADCLRNLTGTMDRNDKNLVDAANKLRHALTDTTALDEAISRR